MAEFVIARECETCAGIGEVGCECSRCTSPEGRATGVLGHDSSECPDCDGYGVVPEPCTGCGDPVDDEALSFDGDLFCSECWPVYGRDAA